MTTSRFRYRFYTGHELVKQRPLLSTAGVDSLWGLAQLVDIGRPKLNRFEILRTTAEGAWINSPTATRPERFVLNGRGKRYAHETIEWALESWCARSSHYERRLVATLKRLREAMEYERAERATVLREAAEIYRADLWDVERDEQTEIVKSPDAWAPPPVRT